MNFTELQTEVKTLLIDTPTAVQNLTPTWINRAIKKLQQKHDFKDMETEIVFVTIKNVRLLGNRPSNWKKPRGKPYLIWSLGGSVSDIVWVSDKANAEAQWGTNSALDFGQPQGIVEDVSGVFNAYPYPDGLSDYSDGEYRVTVPYWGYTSTLVNSGDSNWFTSNAEQYIIYQAVADGFFANEDEQRAQIWTARAEREYKDVLLIDKQRRRAETDTFVMHLGARRPHTQE